MTTKPGRSPGRSTRDELVDAAKQLFYERGYEATSPRLIQDASHAGQGSFYHHVPGKIDLAHAALRSIASEEIARIDDLFAASKDPVSLVLAYLDLSRDALGGCRLGRFAYETSIAREQISDPVVEYFRHLQGRLAEAIADAQRQGLMKPGIDAERTALAVMATVQGAFILARAHGRSEVFEDAIAGARALLEEAVLASRGRDAARGTRTRNARTGSGSKKP